MGSDMLECKREHIRNLLKRDSVNEKIISTILRGDRIEIVPSKDGAKILRVKKSEVK